jgi:hypothetical protein
VYSAVSTADYLPAISSSHILCPHALYTAPGYLRAAANQLLSQILSVSQGNTSLVGCD